MKKLQTLDEKVDRFLSKIVIDLSTNCWNWIGSAAGKKTHKYGSLAKGTYGEDKAHRYMYWLCNGNIPKGKVICHRCDNCLCVNPMHLFLGTQQDNVKDMFQKNRTLRNGHNNGRAKLTYVKVATIRKLYRATRSSYESLAKEYKVSKSTIAMIIRGETWI